MTASEQHDRSTRLEREVREILERADAEQRPIDTMQNAVRRKRYEARASVANAWRRPSLPAALNSEIARIVAALVLAIVAAAVTGWSHLLAIVVAIASLVMFFSLWLPSRGPSSFDAPRWRGQDLRDPGSGPRWPRRPTR